MRIEYETDSGKLLSDRSIRRDLLETAKRKWIRITKIVSLREERLTARYAAGIRIAIARAIA